MYFKIYLKSLCGVKVNFKCYLNFRYLLNFYFSNAHPFFEIVLIKEYQGFGQITGLPF